MVAYVVRVTIPCFEISEVYHSQSNYTYRQMVRDNDSVVKYVTHMSVLNRLLVPYQSRIIWVWKLCLVMGSLIV